MIPQLSASAIRQAMRFAADERRLARASRAALEYMHRQPIATAWGHSDLASSDMMSLETSRHVWQARIDRRRQTPAVGIYSHVRDRWGISCVQPTVLNERQAGAAIEGRGRDETLETTQLATDTQGHTDVAMALARLVSHEHLHRHPWRKRYRGNRPASSYHPPRGRSPLSRRPDDTSW